MRVHIISDMEGVAGIVRGTQTSAGLNARIPLCLLSQSDQRFPKYPAQPVVRCAGHQPRPTGDQQHPSR